MQRGCSGPCRASAGDCYSASLKRHPPVRKPCRAVRALADELVRADLAAHGEQDLETTLKGLAEFRATLPEIDGLVLARDARAQLEQRGDS